jgi:flagellar motor switch protein FliN/FliY
MAQDPAGTGMAHEDDASSSAATAQAVVSAAQAVGRQAAADDDGSFDLLQDVELTVTVELGRAHMEIRDILNVGSGTIVELGKLVSEPVDVLVNGTPFAQGEVVVVDDAFAVRITRLLDRNHLVAKSN